MLCRTLHLPESVALPLTTGVAMLALFPFMKRWLPKVTFVQWVIVVVVGALSTGLIYFAFRQLGWG
jgi:Na+-transporting NADH:ubiquinone oxidoreductase subunit NqrB